MSVGADTESETDFEINLAPIIDCFTVLITYLLVSASFLSLNILDVAVATSTDQPDAVQQPLEPQDVLAVELGQSNLVAVVISGKNNIRLEIPAESDGTADVQRMQKEISGLQKKWPALQEVSVKADASVEYKQIIKVIETLKKSMPRVFLGE